MSRPFVPGWTTTIEAQRATPEQRAAALRDAIHWVERTGRFMLHDDGETMAREMRALGRFDVLRSEDVAALIELAERLGGAAQTSDERRARREAQRWVAEEGYRLTSGRMREELGRCWPDLPQDELRNLEREADYRRRMVANEKANEAMAQLRPGCVRPRQTRSHSTSYARS